MKNRLPALDGLRGLAALSVVFSHAGYSPILLTASPIILTAYHILAVGPNSVQILFVLSGFLMALLYSVISSATVFIKKRYARIFPIYAVIVLFIWLAEMAPFVHNDLLKLGLLGGLALFVFGLWKVLQKLPKAFRVGKILFWSFVGLQVSMLLVNLFVTPKFISSDQLILPETPKQILILLSNITLTTPFVKDVPRMSGVFWSLAPEILFYLVYPFVVIPLIYLTKRFGILVGAIIVICTTKILFDLDHAVVSVGALQSMNIARASGFIAGVVAGTIYQSRGMLWEKIGPIVSNQFVSLFSLLLFIAIQWGDTTIRDGQSITFMNFYYLVSSWIIAFVILTAIVPKTISNKVFSTKLLVFLGLVSYSLYLVHTNSIEGLNNAMHPLRPLIHSGGVFDLISLAAEVFMSVGIAWFLFNFVERLYFLNKKPILETTLATEDELVKTKNQYFSKRKIIFSAVVTFIIIVSLYAGAFTPTLLLSRHSITGAKPEIALLQHSMKIPFVADKDNLSAVSVYLRYTKSAGDTINKKRNPAVLTMTLYDDKGKKIFSSERKAYSIEGSPFYGFGIPTIQQSKEKHYMMELALKNGDLNDQIFVDTSSTSFVSVYTTTKSEVLHNPFGFIINRIAYVFSNPNFLFAAGFLVLATLAVPFSMRYVSRPKR